MLARVGRNLAVEFRSGARARAHHPARHRTPTRHAAGIRSAGAALRLAGLVAWDIVLANIAVARLVLGPIARLRPGFVRVPLAVTHPHVIALFASIVSIVPGSVSMALTPDGRTLLVHVLDLEDAEHFIATIKERYERPLLEILKC